MYTASISSEAIKSSISLYDLMSNLDEKLLSFSLLLPKTPINSEYWQYFIECAKAVAILPVPIIPQRILDI